MEIGQKMRNAQSYVFVLESLNLLLECVDCKRYKECFGIFGGIDFSNLSITLGSAEGAPVLAYGNFITAVINFLITALVIFCMIKGLNKLNERFSRKEEEPDVPTTKVCPFCKSEIAVDATRCPHCTSQLEEIK